LLSAANALIDGTCGTVRVIVIAASATGNGFA
jgi:hypothetical protein